jgi:acetyltransferase-like isoleucine patch superfamily enzyme
MISSIRSFYWRSALKLKGAQVGKGLRVEGPVNILCRDGSSYQNIHIGDNVRFGGKTYLRLRANGSIRIEDNTSLGTEVWLVTANDAMLSIGRNTQIGSYCIFNAGHGIDIGDDCWFSAFVYLNSSDHRIERGRLIREQGYIGAPIRIGNDNWVGGHVFVTKGVVTGNGVVLGAGAIVTKHFPDYAVVVGNPGRILKYRRSPV